MPLQFTPKTEAELSKFENLPDGTYPFTVLESDEVASKSVKNAGKIMVKLKIKVHGPDNDKWVYDYFADWFSEWKLKHFCDTVGLEDEYLTGCFDARGSSLAGRTGYVRIVSESDKDGKLRNVVDDYIPPSEQNDTPPQKTAPAKKESAELEKDDVPF